MAMSKQFRGPWVAAGVALAAIAVSSPVSAQVPGKTLILREPAGVPLAACTLVQGQAVATNEVSVKQSFLDEFKSLDKAALGRPVQTATNWLGYYAFGNPMLAGARTLSANQEHQIYVDPGYAGTTSQPLRLDPFKITPEGLLITATQTPAELKSALSNFPFYSGMLESKKLFSQTFGYFEAKVKMPTGKAMWPAFWLLNSNGAWPPEIDVFEMFDGNNPDKLAMTTHWKSNGNGAHDQTYCNVTVANSSTQYHLYGVLWNPNRITYYVDREPVATLATPAGLDTSMYMLINLAVEKGHDATTPSTASLGVGWVTAYKY